MRISSTSTSTSTSIPAPAPSFFFSVLLSSCPRAIRFIPVAIAPIIPWEPSPALPRRFSASGLLLLPPPHHRGLVPRASPRRGCHGSITTCRAHSPPFTHHTATHHATKSRRLLPCSALSFVTSESSIADDCPICLEQLVSEKQAIKTKCGHWFHPLCLHKAFVRNSTAYETPNSTITQHIAHCLPCNATSCTLILPCILLPRNPCLRNPSSCLPPSAPAYLLHPLQNFSSCLLSPPSIFTAAGYLCTSPRTCPLCRALMDKAYRRKHETPLPPSPLPCPRSSALRHFCSMTQ